MTEELPEAPAQPALSPGLVMRLATSFMATRYLIAAVEVGVFGALGDGAPGLSALAARIAVPSQLRFCNSLRLATVLNDHLGDLNAEQGDQVWVCSQLRASWPKIWPSLRYLG